MRRLPPSEVVREEIQGLFTTDVEGANMLSRLAEFGVRYLAQQALKQEQEDHLGRGRYERPFGRGNRLTSSRPPSLCCPPK